jgi:lysophospholipase L1-like esterase
MSKNNKVIKLIIAATLLLVVIILAFSFFFRRTSMTYEEKVAGFASENSKLEKGQIVFLGDSITAGYKLGIHYYDSPLKTYNRGISGDTTGWMLTRLQESIFDIAPSKIVLMIGTNDINADKSTDEILANYETILSLISSILPDTEVICVSIIPQNTKYSENASENNLRICETNAKIQVLAHNYGYRFVNLYDSLTDDGGLLKREYSNDGLHLNFRGYIVWTRVLKEILY